MRVSSDQQRRDADLARGVDGRRASVGGRYGAVVRRRRRGDVRAGLDAGRGGDGVLRRRRRGVVP